MHNHVVVTDVHLHVDIPVHVPFLEIEVARQLSTVEVAFAVTSLNDTA